MSIYRLRLKILAADRITGVFLLLTSAVIIAVMISLNIHAVSASRIPVGLVLEDDSRYALELKDKICSNDCLEIHEGSFEYLTTLLKDGYINSIFVVNKNYGEALVQGKTVNLINVYSCRDDRISVLLQDIVAGEMMYEVCVNKTLETYMDLKPPHDDTVHSEESYISYAESLKNDESFDFSFIIETESVGASKSAQVENALVYRQVIMGILALLLMLTAFCICNVIAGEYETQIPKRLKTAPAFNSLLQGFKKRASELLAILTFAAPVSVLSVVLLWLSDTGHNGSVFILILINLAFTLFASILFYLMAIIAKSGSAYQSAGCILIIALGVCGFLSIFEGIAGTGIFKYTPVAAYIRLLIRQLI